MTQAVSEAISNKVSYLSVQQFYASISDRPEPKYELEAGILITIPPKPISNSLTYQQVFVEISGRRGRNPDLLILGAECFNALEQNTQGTITHDLPAPLVAIEIISPNGENIACDYRSKRSEYAARGISEYWIVDPQQKKVTVFTLVEGFYDEVIYEVIYTEEEQITSQAVPEIKIKVNKIL